MYDKYLLLAVLRSGHFILNVSDLFGNITSCNDLIFFSFLQLDMNLSFVFFNAKKSKVIFICRII